MTNQTNAPVARIVSSAAPISLSSRALGTAVASAQRPGVGGQEDLIQPVGLGRGIDRRLARAMAGQMDVDEVAALGLGRCRGQRIQNVLVRRRAGGPSTPSASSVMFSGRNLTGALCVRKSRTMAASLFGPISETRFGRFG